MANIITRAGKGAPLSWNEADANFINLNTELAAHINDAIDAHVSSAIGYLPSGTGAVATDVQTQLRNIQSWTVNVKDAPFYAKGDGVTDDTAAINTALAYLASIGGGTLYFPQGSYKTTAEIVIPSSSIHLRGNGRRKCYPGLFVPSANTLSTIFGVHTGRNLFKISSDTLDVRSNFNATELNFATLETGPRPTAAFGFECGNFQRDFTFYRCGIHGFTSAFDVYVGTGSPNREMGVFKATNCSINRNSWIARNLDGTQWNGFIFEKNEAGQNGYGVGGGGIAISGHAVAIEYNLLEGQRDPVYVFGSYRGISIRANYFEANVGAACIQLKDIRGPWFVGPNTYGAVNYADLGQLVLLGTACGMGQCVDPYWPEMVHKTNLPNIGNDAGTGDVVLNSNNNMQFGRVDKIVEHNFSNIPQYSTIAKQAVTVNARELNPQTGMPMPVQEYTTAGVGNVPLNYTISGPSGSWVVMSWLIRHVADAFGDFNPYVTIDINGTSAAGSRDIPISKFTTYWNQGEWALITCATKLGVAMTNVTLQLYPYGVNPTAGRVSRFLRPVVYVVDNANKIIPYIDNNVAQRISGAPAAGTWELGDILNNANPSAGGQGQFLCTVAGTPGTWVYG